MQLFLDTAELDEVRTGVRTWGVVSGVTTNPTLIAKAGQDHETQVKKICEIVGNVSAECVSEKKDDLVVEGRRIASWHKNVIVKLPMTWDGLGAAKILAGEGIRINVTLCFSVNQALLAASVGAFIVSPFVGRLDDINQDGIQLIHEVVDAYRQQSITTKVLSASLRNPIHVQDSALAGADIATMPFKVMESLVKHPLTDQGVERFLADYRKTQEPKPVGTPQGKAATKA
jgi:transaldolase